MRLTGFRWIAASSLLIAVSAMAATRPHYGGSVRVQMAEALGSLDPAAGVDGNISALICDPLVMLNDRGEPQAALASSWQADPGNQRWQFVMRPGVRFSDQTPLTPEDVAVSLRRVNPEWKVTANDTAVTIQLAAPSPILPAELALPRNSIAKIASGKTIGTGPFAVSEWDAGKKLILTAREDYWGGRAFLDSIEIDMARNFRDQMMAFDLGQAQVIEVPPDALRAAGSRQLRTSEPIELVALLFAREAQAPDETKQRQALALSIDRNALNNVVLQGGAAAAGSLLPDWLSGYGFLFAKDRDITRAQQMRAELAQAPQWSLGFDQNDPLERVIAERILLNASDAGLRLQLTNRSDADVRLVRVKVDSLDLQLALRELCKALGISPPQLLGNSADDLYHAETAVLQSQRMIPLLHLRAAWAVSKNVRNWDEDRGGSWHLPDVWLAAGKP